MTKRKAEWTILVLVLVATGGGVVIWATGGAGGGRGSRGTNIIDTLQPRLNNPATRAEAIRELGEKRIAEAVEMLHSYIENDRNPEVRIASAQALAKIGGLAAAMAVRGGLDDLDAQVRAGAAAALGEMKRADSILWLTEALGDASSLVRRAAVEALIKTPGAKSLAAVAGMLGDPAPDVAKAAIDGLVQVGKPAIRHVEHVLGDGRSGDVPYRSVVAALAGMNDVETAPVLVRLLSHEKVDGEAVAAAVEALVGFGADALGAIDDGAIRTPSSLIHKQRAAQALLRIGKPAVRCVAERILAWKFFPREDELKLWVSVLEQIGRGDPKAEEAIRRAEAQLNDRGFEAGAE